MYDRISSTDFVLYFIKIYKMEDIYVPCGHFNMLLISSVSCLTNDFAIVFTMVECSY